MSLLSFALSSLALGLVFVIRKRDNALARKRHAVDVWLATSPARFEARMLLPYEHDENEVSDFQAELRNNGCSPEQKRALTQYLSLIETLGAGVSAGLLDSEVLRSIDGPRLAKVWSTYEEYIKNRRIETGNEFMFEEVRKLSSLM